ncbi:MAG TPA: glycosyltransferase family 1 protein [Burkholderiaceae bacterium]
MKILIVTEAWNPQINGVVRTLKMTSRELTKLGHTVELLTPEGFSSIPCPTYPDIRLSITTPGEVARRIDAFEPDCLHIATEGPLGWMARAVALRRRWPFTTAYHSRFPEYIHARIRFPLSWSYAALRAFHNAGRGTLVPTPAIVSALRERGFDKARLWSRGVDLGTFTTEGDKLPRTAGREKDPVFLYVGRLAIEKNIEAFLALDLPGEKWVAGEGPAAARLKARFPHARWLGVLDGPSLATLYRSADVMVFPSLTDTFGLVILESLACGTPVAAYPVAGPIDVIGTSNAGVMHEDLKTACLEALKVSREAARAHAEKFSWTEASLQFLSALQPIRQQVEPAASVVQA